MYEIQTSNSGQNNTKFLNRFDINAEQAEAMTDLLRESVEAKHNVGFAELEVKDMKSLKAVKHSQRLLRLLAQQKSTAVYHQHKLTSRCSRGNVYNKNS